MNLNRACPFCGNDEQKLEHLGPSSSEGLLSVVRCTKCTASTDPLYCNSDTYNKLILEWKEGIIVNSYIRKIR